MNKYTRGLVVIPCGFIKMIWTKLFHMSSFRGPVVCQISPYTEITLDGGKLIIGKGFKMRDGAKIRVRKGAVCTIGKNTSVNSNNMIACRECIKIGVNVQLSPNVQIYDHDHDFRTEGGVVDGKYKTAPIEIGDNCWIGANTVILRGTKLGDKCIVGAGCVLKGEYPKGSVIVQKRETEVR